MALHPGLEIFTTADGSPTLSFTREDGYIEKMHHSGGALAESLYIYHHGLAKALDAGMPARVVSVGLGLGYNELIATAEFARRGIEGKIWSFEAMPYLRDSFRAWLKGQADPEYTAILDEVCAGIEKHFGISGLRALASCELRGPFPQDAAGVENAGVIFFDAFSNKMSPELWQEMDLEKNLAPLLAEHALLCTYAKTGALKRVLKNLGFKMEERPGFQGKRDSTLALR
jgi:hypothetical protein